MLHSERPTNRQTLTDGGNAALCNVCIAQSKARHVKHCNANSCVASYVTAVALFAKWISPISLISFPWKYFWFFSVAAPRVGICHRIVMATTLPEVLDIYSAKTMFYVGMVNDLFRKTASHAKDTCSKSCRRCCALGALFPTPTPFFLRAWQ